ncbi:hypothetical protein F4782DRAFT_543611 [Xylaria castorea]|nr:hypothetical protein F4782DRAFT_543611 [Xylaria castorea]
MQDDRFVQSGEGDEEVKGLPLWIIPLAPTGDHGSGFHTRNDPARPFQRTNYIERTGAVEVRCSCVDVIHGLLKPDSNVFCTLLVLEFRFDSRKQARRISSIDIELRFSSLNGPSHPEVNAIAPCGNFNVAPTTQSESFGFSANLGLSPVPAPAPTLSASINYDQNITRDMTYAATVVGATALRGRNFGGPNSASWALLENPETKTGVPVALKAAILLNREDEEIFQCVIAIKARADWRSSLESVFGSTPLDDPVLFDPTMQPTNAAYDVVNLGCVDLGSLSSIISSNVIPGTVEMALGVAKTRAG